ncbi:hypothetical protein [Cellulophaga baltica]|uniref:Uncharacterized protein n=1 Tax=Cellulophaga baltica TaxID=76594 RepID=A0A1G7DJ33_9FLAO|nr:hypothetical protein [Cellulophaga baltica]AIY12787.1 hypothetical protein M667_05945 [Cellulophaga baltica NN016038]MBA6313692.1 hypothetical protein [Cellulophaga baltica]SDE51509.1 hypothetical protein SAMN04487992_101601 [Cellulophaga baltica]
MAKEKFNWKSLFVNDENASTTTTSKSEEKIDFPNEPTPTSSSTQFPQSSAPQRSQVTSTNIDNAILNSVIEMYESGFESLNLPGYDFYEFFKAIKAVGSNDPNVYKMAFTMAQSVDAKVTKESLLDGANFYIKEINDVHEQYHTKGNAKKEEFQSSLLHQKETLSTEIAELEKQILQLQTQASDKKNQLNALENGTSTEMTDIEQKITANDIAKTKILEIITTVADGIKINL